MRDYSKSISGTWVDHIGRVWPIIQSRSRLRFRYPAHAALRAFVFYRDSYTCVRCGAFGIDIPDDYSGETTLFTDTFTKSGHRDCLIVDHIVTLKAGGLNVIENFQTLCETCNKKKLKQDLQNIAANGGSK